MLENIDIAAKFDKAEYKRLMPQLEIRLSELQRQLIDFDLPVIVVFEGWAAAGRGVLLNKLISALDPRGFSVYSTYHCQLGEQYPYMYRFWSNIPAKGRIAFFDRSWYNRFVVNPGEDNSERNKYFEQVNSFERQLAADNYIIIKIFLHISEDEQKKRLKGMGKLRAARWRVTEGDWDQNDKYDKRFAEIQTMIRKTDSYYAPWTIVPAHDKKYAAVQIYRTLIDVLENKIESCRRDKSCFVGVKQAELTPLPPSVLNSIDLTKDTKEEEYRHELKLLQKRLRQIQYAVYSQQIPLIIVYEGWDAAGKGSNIKRLTQNLDPRGYEVIPIGPPNEVERKHHYLWRFWKSMPYAGKIAIFDRSWYGRVLVERVEGFCHETDWKRAYQEINEMEEQITDYGGIIVKFWLHIDKQEQLQRFRERQQIPYKQWKITEEDWRNREKWDYYRQAADEMLFRTSTNYAPWHIVEGNSKLYARLKTINTVIKAVEDRL